jgi:excisionase family DNA binding protein
MEKKEYITIPELAKILGVSRVTIYNRVKKGQIKAEKFGRVYVIHRKYVDSITGKALSEKDKKIIEKAVKRTFREYGDVLKLLGKE